ncbi:MAG: murein tripeptide amidase MpaA [Bdellovibrio sp.]
MNFISIKSGTTVEGAEIEAFRTESRSQKWIYLIAGVHGDEVEGVYCLQQLFDWLKNNDDLPQTPMVVIPILNIDGYRAGTRTNSHGVDLNRNLPAKSWSNVAREAKYFPGTHAMSEPENVYLDKLFQKFPPAFIVSFHSWKPMLNINGNCRKFAEIMHDHNQYPIIDDIEGHPTPGSMGDYAPEKYNAPVLTLEFPVLSDGKTLKEIWDENSSALKALIESSELQKIIQ